MVSVGIRRFWIELTYTVVAYIYLYIISHIHNVYFLGIVWRHQEFLCILENLLISKFLETLTVRWLFYLTCSWVIQWCHLVADTLSHAQEQDMVKLE